MVREESKPEHDFLELLRAGDHSGVRSALDDPAKSVAVQQNWNFVRKCVKEAVGTGDEELIRSENYDLLVTAYC